MLAKKAREPKRAFALRPKARADLDDIWDYTVETWGLRPSGEVPRYAEIEPSKQSRTVPSSAESTMKSLQAFGSTLRVGISFSTFRRPKESTSPASWTNGWISRRIVATATVVVTVEDMEAFKDRYEGWGDGAFEK